MGVGGAQVFIGAVSAVGAGLMIYFIVVAAINPLAANMESPNVPVTASLSSLGPNGDIFVGALDGTLPLEICQAAYDAVATRCFCGRVSEKWLVYGRGLNTQARRLGCQALHATLHVYGDSCLDRVSNSTVEWAHETFLAGDIVYNATDSVGTFNVTFCENSEGAFTPEFIGTDEEKHFMCADLLAYNLTGGACGSFVGHLHRVMASAAEVGCVADALMETQEILDAMIGANDCADEFPDYDAFAEATIA